MEVVIAGDIIMTKAPNKKAPAKETGASKKGSFTKEISTEMPISEKDEVKRAEDNTNKAANKGA
jgi:hypothetical protein